MIINTGWRKQRKEDRKMHHRLAKSRGLERRLVWPAEHVPWKKDVVPFAGISFYFLFFVSINLRYLWKWRFLVSAHFTDTDADNTSDSHKTSCVSWIAVGVAAAVAAAVCASLMWLRQRQHRPERPSGDNATIPTETESTGQVLEASFLWKKVNVDWFCVGDQSSKGKTLKCSVCEERSGGRVWETVSSVTAVLDLPPSFICLLWAREHVPLVLNVKEAVVCGAN